MGYVGIASPYPGIPTTARGYWDAAADQTNTWPTLVR